MSRYKEDIKQKAWKVSYVWKRFKDIDFDKLPKQFVLKCTHDSGGMVIVRDKNKMDKAQADKKLSACLKSNFYSHKH